MRPQAIRVLDLGRTRFAEAFECQLAVVAARRCGEDPDTLLLTEHEAVATLGRSSRPLSSEALSALRARAIEVCETNRGGAATYHCPGQLVAYPILDLREHGADLHGYIRGLEIATIAALEDLGIPAIARPGLRGVWVGERKIASLGVAVRGWVSYHGVALNVDCDLTPFALFAPCGLEGVEMTSVARELGTRATTPGMAQAKSAFVRAFAQRFGFGHCQTVLTGTE